MTDDITRADELANVAYIVAERCHDRVQRNIAARRRDRWFTALRKYREASNG